MVRLIALWAIFIAGLILFVIFREEQLVGQGKVPVGRLRRLWLQTENRRTPRYRVDWEIRYTRMGAEEAAARARTRDLSKTGVGLIVNEYLEKGSQIHLKLTLPGRKDPVAVDGQVAWTKEVPTQEKDPSQLRLFFVGIQFIGVDPDMAKRLAEALRGGDEIPWR